MTALAAALVCVGAVGLVLPTASAEGIGKGKGVQGCDDVLVTVPRSEKLDGVRVPKGVYGLGVKNGVSCDEAEALVEDWIDSGRVDGGFDAVPSDSDLDLVFENDNGTASTSDDEAITLIQARFLSCAFTRCPLGSTVTVVNQSGIRSGTYPDITVSNTETRPEPVTLPFYGANSVRYSNMPSGTTTDLRIQARATGAAMATNSLSITAYSSSLNGGEVCLSGPAPRPRTAIAMKRTKPARVAVAVGDSRCVSPAVGTEAYFSFRDADSVPDQVRGFVRRLANENDRYTYRITLYLVN
jgi:hypothetical protein